jgi:hypothetical protein
MLLRLRRGSATLQETWSVSTSNLPENGIPSRGSAAIGFEERPYWIATASNVSKALRGYYARWRAPGLRVRNTRAAKSTISNEIRGYRSEYISQT